MKSGVTVRLDKAMAVLAALNSLEKRGVLVGIPAEDSDRDDTPFGNAAIGYLNETGSPAQNIPSRPHLKPGVQSVQGKTLPHLKQAALAVLAGNAAGAERELSRAGAIAADGVRHYITASSFTPLAGGTLAARARKGRKGAANELASRAAGHAPDNAAARPLIDTGQYRRAITWIVRNKNAGS